MLAYSGGSSLIHLADARVKMLWLVALLWLMFASRTVPNAILSLALAVLLCVISGMSFFSAFPSWKFIAFVAVFSLLFGWFFSSIEQGLANAIILVSAVAISIIFILTTERDSLVSALRFFGIPRKTAFSLALSLYFLPSFELKFQSIRSAQASRANAGNNPIPLVIPFMHSVLGKARKLSLSLDARGFNPEKAEVPYKLKMKKFDWLALALLILLVSARIYYMV